jgi:hypothetical protein
MPLLMPLLMTLLMPLLIPLLLVTAEISHCNKQVKHKGATASVLQHDNLLVMKVVRQFNRCMSITPLLCEHQS